MEDHQIEAKKQALIQAMFQAAAKQDKTALAQAFMQKYTIEEMLNKPDPNSPTGITKVKRKTIRTFFSNMGEITNPQGLSVFDVLIQGGFFLFAVNIIQNENFGVLRPYPGDEKKRYFDVILQPSNYFQLVKSAHKDVPAQMIQRRGFIRRLAYGQPVNPDVDAFLKDHYEDLLEDLIKFREKIENPGSDQDED